MTPRGTDRRKGRAQFLAVAADRRRPHFERRGTVRQVSERAREVELYGERRRRPDVGTE